MFRDTSRAAYNSLDLQKREREVLLFIHTHLSGCEFTRRELADAMGWRDCRITGRVLSLIEKGYLEELKTKRDGGYLLRIADAQQSLQLAAA